jgi:hypothetical protein
MIFTGLLPVAAASLPPLPPHPATSAAAARIAPPTDSALRPIIVVLLVFG